MPNGAAQARSETTDEMLLVDHHVHGVVGHELDRQAFELLISESGLPAREGSSHFESPVGLAIRKWCAPLLGLEEHAAPEAYLEARAALGPREVNERFLRRAGLEAMLVETGHKTDEVLGPVEMGELASVPTGEIARIERVAELVAERVGGPAEFLDAFPRELGQVAEKVSGLKTIVAYRTGFGIAAERPDQRVLASALNSWFASSQGSFRLGAPALESYVLDVALEVARMAHLPLQVHAGFGDPDLTLHLSDPVVFTNWVRRYDAAGVPLLFLHCYPYHRQAGYLAEVYRNVYFDVGCILNYSGPSSRRVLAEALELAPFQKMLYSSDGFGLAELVYMGAALFRTRLGSVLRQWVADGECIATDAKRITELVSRENARSLYRLEPQEDS